MKRIIDFLKDLRANNNREWFADNKGRYVEAAAIFNDFAGQLIAAIGEFDPSVRELALRDCTYRIYRDTRFSHDKTPYKTHFGVYVCPGGKKSGNAGYYFHIEPPGESAGDGSGGAGENEAGCGSGDAGDAGGTGGCFLLDAGIYMPLPAVLKSVRDEILDNGGEVLAAIDRAARAGFGLDRSNSLKRTPQGYPPGSPWDEYLKLKDFHLAKFVDEEYVLAKELAKMVAADYRATLDFMTLMNRAARFAHEEG